MRVPLRSMPWLASQMLTGYLYNPSRGGTPSSAKRLLSASRISQIRPVLRLLFRWLKLEMGGLNAHMAGRLASVKKRNIDDREHAI
jgi:hypothetical protein